jgi:hypothetical protein
MERETKPKSEEASGLVLNVADVMQMETTGPSLIVTMMAETSSETMKVKKTVALQESEALQVRLRT